MPTLSKEEIKALEIIGLTPRTHRFTSNLEVSKSLVDKSLAWPNGERIELSEYGRKTLSFIREIRQGLHKPKPGCNQDCSNC